MIARSLTALASRRQASARLLILTYHRVLPRPDPMLQDDIDVDAFAEHAAVLAQYFRVLPLPEAVAALYAGRLPARSACITFDDGYANNRDVALPVLDRFRLPASFFIATDYLDGGRMWNDTVIEALRRIDADHVDLGVWGLGTLTLGNDLERNLAAKAVIDKLKYLDPALRLERCNELAARCSVELPSDLMMSSDAVRALDRAGMDVGAHTLSHPILAQVSDSAAQQEVQGSADRLAELLGHRVTSFAYPNGRPDRDYRRIHAAMVERCGFSLAVTTAWGFNDRSSGRYELARVAPWDRGRLRLMGRLLRAYFERGAGATLA